MYNYDFNNEKVLFEKPNTLVKINENTYYLNVLITESNILLFKDLNRDFVKQKSLGVFVSSEYELVKSISLKDLNYKCVEEDTIINNEEIVLYDVRLDKVIN